MRNWSLYRLIYLKKNNIFEITLLFLNNKIITLTAEIIEVILEDQKSLNDKNTEL